MRCPGRTALAGSAEVVEVCLPRRFLTACWFCFDRSFHATPSTLANSLTLAVTKIEHIDGGALISLDLPRGWASYSQGENVRLEVCEVMQEPRWLALSRPAGHGNSHLRAMAIGCCCSMTPPEDSLHPGSPETKLDRFGRWRNLHLSWRLVRGWTLPPCKNLDREP